MDPTSAVAKVGGSLAMGSFSRQEVVSLPLEMIYEIFSWLTPRDRHPLYQDPLLKKVIASLDRFDWKPYQEFINEVSDKVEQIAARELKDEFSSLLTNLIELNVQDKSFCEREADFFFALFELSYPTFSYLCKWFKPDHPFIEEGEIYQCFKMDVTSMVRRSSLICLMQRGHLFTVHKIFPSLSFYDQSKFIRNLTYVYSQNPIIEPGIIECYREELVFFTKKLLEMPDTLTQMHMHIWCFSFGVTLVFLIHCGYLEDARELFQILPCKPSILNRPEYRRRLDPQIRKSLDSEIHFSLFHFSLCHSSLENTRAFLRMFPGNNDVASAFQAGFLFAASRFLEEEKGVSLFEHFTHEDLNWAPPAYRRFLTPILKKFIKKLSGSLEEGLESELKRELSSLLTNLTELNGKDDKIGALFLTLFHLTPPAFDYLCTHLGEDRHFIFLEEVSIYRNFAPPIPLLPPPLTLEETLLKSTKGESFFLPDQIFLLLPVDYQACCLANMLYLYWTEAKEGNYHKELVSCAENLAEITTIEAADYANRAYYFKYALQALIHLGHQDEARELARIFPKNHDVEEMFCKVFE